jgi:hypothetical protein
MTAINNLSTIDALAGGDQVPIYDSDAGTARKASLSQFVAYFKSAFASPDYTTILVSPSVSGFNQPIGSQTTNVWLVMTPTGTMATGTVTLPPVADCFDGQQILISCTEVITALTIATNGAGAISGVPNAIGVGGFIALRFSSSSSLWFVSSTNEINATLPSLTLTNATGGTIKDANGAPILDLDPNYVLPVSGTSYLRIRNRNTGADPEIQAVGTDVNIGVQILTKGAGAFLMSTTGSSVSGSGAGSTAMFATGAINLNAPQINAKNLVLPLQTLSQLNAAALAAGNPYGMRGSCSDSGTAVGVGNFSSTFAGGGANSVPCWFDGASWRIG